MSLLSQPGITARDIIEVRVVGETPDPRGSDYGKILGPVGTPVKVVSKPLTGREKYQAGKSEATVAYTLYADLAGSEAITPKARLWHPAEGVLKADGTPNWEENLLDVTSVARYAFGEDLVVVECERTY